MADKKYELVKENTIEYDGKTLYQIKALKDFGDVKTGDLGGYIEKEYNLSQDGNCWVYDKAKVYGEAKVFNYAEISEYSDIYGQAQVYGQAKVYDNTKVFKKAQVYGEAKVYGSAEVYDEARVYGNTKVYGNAEIFGEDCWVYNNAEIYDNAQVYDSADVRDNAKVFGNAQVFENAQVRGNAKIYDNAQIYGNAKVSGNAEVYGTTQVYDNTLVSGNTKIFDTENKKYEFVGGDINDVVEIENTKEIKVEILENEIQKYEEHCSKVVDKLKLQDELPNFQVISQKGVLYEKNSENNNISEIKNFVENLKGEEFFNNMNMNDIRDWENFKNNSDITLVYDSYGEEGDYRLKEYSDFNSYAKETIKPFLVQEISKNPELGDILKEDIIEDEKVKENNKEIKEKEVAKDDREMDF